MTTRYVETTKVPGDCNTAKPFWYFDLMTSRYAEIDELLDENGFARMCDHCTEEATYILRDEYQVRGVNYNDTFYLCKYHADHFEGKYDMSCHDGDE